MDGETSADNVLTLGGTLTSPSAQYLLNDGSGATATDTYGNNGTITGSSWVNTGWLSGAGSTFQTMLLSGD